MGTSAVSFGGLLASNKCDATWVRAQTTGVSFWWCSPCLDCLELRGRVENSSVALLATPPRSPVCVAASCHRLAGVGSSLLSAWAFVAQRLLRSQRSYWYRIRMGR